MDFLLSSIKKDLGRWKLDTTAILLWIGIPLMIGGLITSMFAGGGTKPTGLLLITDQDETFLSGLIAGAYSQGELGELITAEKVTLAEGTSRIDSGEASGFLLIPEGFQDAFLTSQPVTLTLKTNPSQTILPGVITDVTEVLLDAGFYAEQLFGEEIQKLANTEFEGAPSQAFVTAMAGSIQQKVEGATPHLFPPTINVEVVEPLVEEPGVSLALLFLPGVILMAVMFSASGLAGDFWVERKQGTLLRLVTAPNQLAPFLSGKALAAGIIIAAVGGLTLIIGFLYHGVAWAKLPSSIIWITLSGIGFFAWFGALQLLTANQKAANVITSVLLFPLLMAGGSFFPLSVLPGWIQTLGRASPNGFVADGLTTEITATGAWSIDLQSWLIVLTMTISGLFICAWRLGKFARSSP